VLAEAAGDRGPEGRVVLDEKHGGGVHGCDSAS
jgi:hypothetical protein